RARRPFEREEIALHRARVAIGFDQPCRNELAAGLFEFAERNEITIDGETRFFGEFALRRFERRFAFLIEPLRNRPGPLVLFRPEGPAGMDKEEFDTSSALAVEQQSGTALHVLCFAFGRRITPVFQLRRIIDAPADWTDCLSRCSTFNLECDG